METDRPTAAPCRPAPPRKAARAPVRLAAVLALAAAAALPAGADLFAPNRPLRIIKTEWFDIVHPSDLAEQAGRLASFADETYRRVAAFFGTEPRLRYPVVLTPDSESANGYFTVWPSRRIVLCLAPSDPNGFLGFQSDDLAALFRHELAHAVSLSIRTPLGDALVSVFGDPLGLSFYTTPASLAEGAAIALEDPGGLGRAADPLTAGDIRQDALEGRFKSFWEAAGAWDRYPYGRTPYSYGAVFTRYLRETYGDDSYRELWGRMGRGLLAPGLGDSCIAQGVFRQVYGIPLSKAWSDFEAWISPLAPVLEAERITGAGYRTAVASRGGTIYCADGAAGRIYALDARTGARLRTYAGDATVSRLDVSPDGGRLLVSYLGYKESLPRAALREVDLGTGKSRRLRTRRLRDASYAAGGLAAVRAEPGAASLVLVREGREEVLLAGGATVSYASPCGSPDGKRVYALRRKDGVVSIVRVEVPAAGAAGADLPAEVLALPEGLRSLRYLSVDEEETLRFSWYDGSFYRIAEVRKEECAYQTAPVSGGVHYPLGTAGGVSYLGFFSEGASLCTLDPNRADPAWAAEPVRWEALDKASEIPLASKTAASDAESPGISPGDGGVFETRRYSVLPWILPRFWYPVFTLSSGSLWSLGAAAVGADPAERFALNLRAEWVPDLAALNLSAALGLTGGAAAVVLNVSDTFKSYSSGILEKGYLGVAADRDFPLYGGVTLGLRAEAGITGFAWADPRDPYRGYDDALALGSAAVSYGRWGQDITRPAASKGFGFRVLLFGALPQPPTRQDFSFLPGIETALFLRALPASLSLDLYGAYSLAPGLNYGPEGRTIRSYHRDGSLALGYYGDASYPSYEAFSGTEGGSFYAYADASAAPLVLEAQGRLGPVYLRRFVLRAGGRAAVSAGGFLHSMYARLSLYFAPLVGALARLRPYAWGEVEFAPERGEWSLRLLLDVDP